MEFCHGGEGERKVKDNSKYYTKKYIEQNFPYFTSTFTGIITGDNTYSIAFIFLQFPQNGCAL